MIFLDKKKIKLKKLEHFKGKLPSYESLGASGMDVRAQLKESLRLSPFKALAVPTALSLQIPPSYEIQVRPRSGLALKKGISVLNTPGTIDSDYRGELKIILMNFNKEDFLIEDQDRIAQIVLCPVVRIQWEEVLQTDSTKRGEKGFGSTGFK